MIFRQRKFIHATCLELFTIPCNSIITVHEKDRLSHRYQLCELKRNEGAVVVVKCRDFACSKFRFEVHLSDGGIKFPDDAQDCLLTETMLDLIFQMATQMLLEESEIGSVFTKTYID